VITTVGAARKTASFCAITFLLSSFDDFFGKRLASGNQRSPSLPYCHSAYLRFARRGGKGAARNSC